MGELDRIETLARERYKHGAHGDHVLITTPAIKAELQEELQTLADSAQGKWVRDGELAIQTVMTPFGEVHIYVSRWVTPGKMYMMSREAFEKFRNQVTDLA